VFATRNQPLIITAGFGELEGNAVGKDTKTGTFFIYSPPDDRPEYVSL
jgi:hypothetical protein